MGFSLETSIPVLTVFVQGLLSFFSPCVLPLIPLYVGYLAGGAGVANVSGDGAVAKCRSLMGATNPAEAAPGTIRGDFGLIMDENVIHGSDSPESAEREIGIFFA